MGTIPDAQSAEGDDNRTSLAKIKWKPGNTSNPIWVINTKSFTKNDKSLERIYSCLEGTRHVGKCSTCTGLSSASARPTAWLPWNDPRQILLRVCIVCGSMVPNSFLGTGKKGLPGS